MSIAAENEERSASLRLHRVCRIANQITHDLADLSVEAKGGTRCAQSLLHDDLSISDSAFMDCEHTLDQTCPIHLGGIRRLLMEAQGVARDRSSPAELLFCGGQ